MAYFNHAFRKAFLATGETQSNINITSPTGASLGLATTSDGYLTTPGLPTFTLNQLSAQSTTTVTTDGYIGWFDPKSNVSLAIGSQSSCCNAYLAGSTLYSCDKLGPLAGGYQETNKSKMINPKYVSRFYSVAPCLPQNNVIHVGSTYWTSGGGVLTTGTLVAGTGYTTGVTTVTGGSGEGMVVSFVAAAGLVTSVTVLNPGKGYIVGETLTLVGGGADATVDVLTATASHSQEGCGTTSTCCKEFLCGETYSLRVDVKGSPAMRFLNHNAYATVDAYTGCCPDNIITPSTVDSTIVMIGWANALTTNPIVAPFIQIVVQTELGDLLYAPGTDPVFLAANGADTWDNYVSPGHTVGACAGLIMNGAYVDTKFGDCSFQISDFYEKEPVKLYASEVDLNGDPCTFDSLCTVTECTGLQAQGLGETILRDLTLSESYRQNFLATDIRIREITQGNQIVSSINRNAQYYRYMLQHNVPRNYNPSGTFDADQYLLEIYSLSPLTTFFGNTSEWLDGCGVCEIEAYTCEKYCDLPILFPTLPVCNPYSIYNVTSCY
jgi:hypothetical protein